MFRTVLTPRTIFIFIAFEYFYILRLNFHKQTHPEKQMKNTGMIGFRVIEKSDLEIIRNEHNDESVLYMLGDPYIVTEYQQLKWWENISSSRTNTSYLLYMDNPSNIIGIWRLQNFDITNRSAEVGIDIFRKFRGRGLAVSSYKMAIKYLFESLNVNCIYARAGEYNEKSLRSLQSAGFKISGRIREALFKNGKYHDNIILCITFSEYKKQTD